MVAKRCTVLYWKPSCDCLEDSPCLQTLTNYLPSDSKTAKGATKSWKWGPFSFNVKVALFETCSLHYPLITIRAKWSIERLNIFLYVADSLWHKLVYKFGLPSTSWLSWELTCWWASICRISNLFLCWRFYRLNWVNYKHLKPKPGLHPDEKAFNLNSVPGVNFINVKKWKRYRSSCRSKKGKLLSSGVFVFVLFFFVCYLSRHNDGETVGGPCHHRHFFIYPVQSGSLPDLLSESLRRASFSSSLVWKRLCCK